MTPIDQRIVAEASSKILDLLSLALDSVPDSSACWTLLVEAVGAAETIEAVCDPSRDGFAPAALLIAPPQLRPERLALVHSVLGTQHPPAMRHAA